MARDRFEDYLKLRLERCHEDLTYARRLLEQGGYRLSINRSYYAIFHIATVALATLSIERSRHSGLEAAFHQYLIKPGLIEPEYGSIYRRARRWREDADYSLSTEFTEETARNILIEAERFVARLEHYLRDQGLVTGETDATEETGRRR